jgi:hypothetical protein
MPGQAQLGMPKSNKPDHVQNKKTEKLGLLYLQSKETGIVLPNLQERKHLLKLIGVSDKFKRTFDAVKLKVASIDAVTNGADFELIEVKVTDKHLPSFPAGFFFGMTENEEMLLKVLEPNFKLCLVSLAPPEPSHRLLTYTDLQQLFRNKRIQYQINL